jgi:MFS family permease
MKKIWPFSFYFLYYAAFACYMPYLVLYYRQIGFSGTQIGVLTAISPLVGLVATPLLTGYADATRRYRLIMSLSLAGCAVLLAFLPTIRTLLPMLLFLFAYTVLGAPISSLADNATMSMLGEQREKYGRIRLGGTLGWAAAATVAGLVIDRFGLQASFWCASGMFLLGLLISQGFVFGQSGPKASIRSGIKTLLTDRNWVLVLFLALVTGIGFATLNNYFTLYLEQAGIARSWMGVALTVATVAEIPVMFFSNRLLQRFQARGLLILALAVFSLRFFLYAISQDLVVILIFQVINALAFPVYMVGAVSFAFTNAPPGLGATAQGVMGMMTFGIGSAAGGLIGGLLLGFMSVRDMYAIVSGVLLFSLLIYLLLQRRSAPADVHG